MAAKKQTLKIEVRIEGARETLDAFNRLEKSANAALRERSMALAEKLAGKVQAAGRASGKQAAAVAATVKARRDRIPVIEAGGSKRVTTSKVPASDIVFGSEFGGNRRTGWYGANRFAPSAGRQFRPHLGRGSYWFYETVYDSQAEIADAWSAAADDIQRDLLKDGG